MLPLQTSKATIRPSMRRQHQLGAMDLDWSNIGKVVVASPRASTPTAQSQYQVALQFRSQYQVALRLRIVDFRIVQSRVVELPVVNFRGCIP